MDYTSTILIVDDEPAGRKTLEALLTSQNYQLAFATNGQEALGQAIQLTPDLILLDVMLPGIDGFEVCRQLRADTLLSEVPIIMITALDDRDSRLQGIEAGADEFISKPFDRVELRARIRTITRLNRYRHLISERTRFERVIELSPDGLMIVAKSSTILMVNPVMLHMLEHNSLTQSDVIGTSILPFIAPEQVDSFSACLHKVLSGASRVERIETIMVRTGGLHFPVEMTIGYIEWETTPAIQVNVRDITERKHAEEQIRRSKDELSQAYDATLVGWVKALDLRDKETEGHSLRVTEMTMSLAHVLGIEGEELEHIRRGSLLHDVGKLGIPDSILLKPGPLSAEERELMRMHPIYAYEWLSQIDYLRPVLDIPLYHHERWDGTGYPNGLKGEEIPLPARMFALVDVWDALRSERPYRPAWPEDTVREHIRSLSGTQFDPSLVEIFLSLDILRRPR